MGVKYQYDTFTSLQDDCRVSDRVFFSEFIIALLIGLRHTAKQSTLYHNY